MDNLISINGCHHEEAREAQTAVIVQRKRGQPCIDVCACDEPLYFADSPFECLRIWVFKPASKHVRGLVDWPNVNISCVLILKQQHTVHVPHIQTQTTVNTAQTGDIAQTSE